MVPIFSDFDIKYQQFLAKKTTNVVFKQHEPQRFAELSGVAAAFLLEVYNTFSRKNYDLWTSSVEKESPSTIWGGGRNLLQIFDF